ncbi:MAG: SHOCT domain-containing protein [Taibaiella sp.]|nr:SHOCT domain-containing protein [Taibaiella sp.]
MKDDEYKEKMLERAAASAPALSVAEELTKLNELRKEGVITDDEFAIQKERLLNAQS